MEAGFFLKYMSLNDRKGHPNLYQTVQWPLEPYKTVLWRPTITSDAWCNA